MPVYRLYFTTHTHQLTGVPMRFECADDAAALIRAAEIARTATNKANGIEVWESRRLVGRVPIERKNSGPQPD
ncbi:MAG: hypothetical protein ABW047_08370 [Nitrospiraceae bacterium]